MGGMILALIMMNIGAFSMFWIVWRSKILHPNEMHKGTGIIHCDGDLVMRQPFVVARGISGFGRV